MTQERESAVRQMRLVVEAEDFEAAVAFYRDVLGLSEAFAVGSERGARVVILEAGTATLEIVNPAQRRMSDEIEVGRQVSRTIRVAFEVGDTTATTAELTAAGADLLAHPTRTPWDSLNSRLEAPAGLQITLFEELGDIESWPTIESGISTLGSHRAVPRGFLCWHRWGAGSRVFDGPA